MIEEREILFAAAGTEDMLGIDDVSGEESLLREAEAFWSEVTFAILGTTATMDYTLRAGTEVLARGRISSGGTIGVMPNENTAAFKTVLCPPDLKLSLPVVNGTGTPSAMLVISREAA